jgi:hypothetical protein
MLCAARMMALLALELGSRVEGADVGESVIDHQVRRVQVGQVARGRRIELTSRSTRPRWMRRS